MRSTDTFGCDCMQALQRQHTWWKLARMHRINHGGLEARVFLLTRTREPYSALDRQLVLPGSGPGRGGRQDQDAGARAEGGEDSSARESASSGTGQLIGRHFKPRGARKRPDNK